MYYQVKEFYRALAAEHGMNPIELAARTHAEFVKIHPFVDGNGRASRMLMNYQLMAAGCSDKARAKASGGRQPIEECGRTGL